MIYLPTLLLIAIINTASYQMDGLCPHHQFKYHYDNCSNDYNINDDYRENDDDNDENNDE